MGKLKLPRGIYLQHRVRADGKILFRWGHAPRLRARGIQPFDLFADGRPVKQAFLVDHGLPAGAPLPADENGTPLLHEGRQEPLSMQRAILAARQLTALLADCEATPSTQSPARQKAGNLGSGGRHTSGASLSPLTVGDLIEDFFTPGKNKRLDNRAEDTARSYRSWRAPVDEIFRDEPCANMDEDLIEDWFWTQKKARGHRMAYGGYQLLRRAWNWGRRKHRLQEIIWSEIDIPKPAPKLRIASELELTYLLRACDDPASLAAELQMDPADAPPARPELGDSIILALWTVQRARDVLAFTEHSIQSGRVRHQTSKKHQRIDLPIVGSILPARLSDLRARRAARGARCSSLVLHPTLDQPYTQKTHGTHFREARALAARFAPSLLGEGLDDWGQAHKPFTFEDLRDTGCTRLLRAGCTIDQVVSWSNHKNANALRNLAGSYLAQDGVIADQAGDLLQDYADKKGLAI